jgi:hypothetical protein
MTDHQPAVGSLVVTAPSEEERLYEIAVRLTRAELVPMGAVVLHPWLKIRANIETGDVLLSAGVRAER